MPAASHVHIESWLEKVEDGPPLYCVSTGCTVEEETTLATASLRQPATNKARETCRQDSTVVALWGEQHAFDKCHHPPRP